MECRVKRGDEEFYQLEEQVCEEEELHLLHFIS